MNTEAIFRTKSGFEFPGISVEKTNSLRNDLFSSLKLTPTHITEACSYSMAMIVRFALGLSADKADVCVLANQTLSGSIALATLRHLVNSGSKARLWLVNSSAVQDPSFENELEIIKLMSVHINYIDPNAASEGSLQQFNDAVLSSHNVICGCFDSNDNKRRDYSKLIEILNEARTPIHCIDAPLGIDPDSGKPYESPLFASSTMSLGTVYGGLYYADTFVGRHYICDISVTSDLYKKYAHDIAPLFSEQPIVQIFPKKTEET